MWGNQERNIVWIKATIYPYRGLGEISCTKVRPSGRERRLTRREFTMKIRRLFLAVVALTILAGLAVPANAMGRHHHRHHHHHRR